MRKTKIVCTLGPSTDREGVLREMMLAGMNVARFNFSHGTHPEHKARLDALKALRGRTGRPGGGHAGYQRSGGAAEELCRRTGPSDRRSGIYPDHHSGGGADGIMVARGDMGVEIDFTEIPAIQKDMIAQCVAAGKPVITATQMLDSMIENPRPTRAEITDVANAIYDGTSAIMLSGETAAGRYPVEAVQTMDAIALRTEADINYAKRMRNLPGSSRLSIAAATAHAACTTAKDIGADAILTVSQSGATARLVSRFRPGTTVVA